MSVRIALATATTRSLSAVSSAASLVDRAITSVDLLAEAGQAHAQLYRDLQVSSCSISAEEMALQAEEDARHRITMRRLAHAERMKDVKYAEIFSSVQLTKSQPQLTAAE